MKLLAGDIGGTRTRLRVAQPGADHLTVLYEKEYRSADHGDFTGILKDCLSKAGTPGVDVASTCLAVAGPVTGATATVTNLPWTINAGALMRETGLKGIRLINDFQATGYGIEALEPGDIVVLQAGEAIAQAPRVVIGAGTGLGEALLVWQQDCYEVIASEGGHVDFGPTNDLQIELMTWLRARTPRVTYERVVSGPGLVGIYDFLLHRSGKAMPSALTAVPESGDAAATISELALSRKDELAAQALDIFVSVYGAQAGNLALTCVATGGVYIAGGIAPQIIDRLREGEFLRAFNDKGRMQKLTQNMRVSVVMNARVGLIGATQVAARV